MVNPIPVIPKGSEDDPWMKCNCSHEFLRSRLDIIRKVSIYEWEGSEADFETEYKNGNFTTIRSECPTCSCCSVEDEEIEEVSGVSGYLCGGCGNLSDDEEDALECCSDD